MAKETRWLDGRRKKWFELYDDREELDSAYTLKACLKKAGGYNKTALVIYEVKSQGGWECGKEDIVVAAYDVVGKRAVYRSMKKSW